MSELPDICHLISDPRSLIPGILSLAGGVDRDRTDDLKLAKLALSQLSYDPVFQEVGWRQPPEARGKRRPPSPKWASKGTHPSRAGGSEGWWARVELNHRPHAYQACALTT